MICGIPELSSIFIALQSAGFIISFRIRAEERSISQKLTIDSMIEGSRRCMTSPNENGSSKGAGRPGGCLNRRTGRLQRSCSAPPFGAVSILTMMLIVQGVIFGDGGLTTMGANIINMGVIGGFVGFSSFHGLMGVAKNGSSPDLG